METFYQTGCLLTKIQQASQAICVQVLELMTLLRDPRNEIVEGVVERIPELDYQSAIELCHRVSMTLGEEATQAINEIPLLVGVEENSFKLCLDKCPLFASIWSGDLYDQEGNKGLQAFLDELRDQQKKLTVQDLTEMAISTYEREAKTGE